MLSLSSNFQQMFQTSAHLKAADLAMESEETGFTGIPFRLLTPQEVFVEECGRKGRKESDIGMNAALFHDGQKTG